VRYSIVAVAGKNQVIYLGYIRYIKKRINTKKEMEKWSLGTTFPFCFLK